jgi:hypothetical protein
VPVDDAEAVQGSGFLLAVAEPAPDGQAARQGLPGRVGLAQPVEQHAEPARHIGQRRSAVGRGQVHGPLQPATALAGVAVLVPERSERLDQPQADEGPVSRPWGSNSASTWRAGSRDTRNTGPSASMRQPWALCGDGARQA